MTTIIGLIAAFLTTAAFLPQAVKSIKSGNTKSLSLPMYVMVTAGVAMWFVYGIMLQSLPIILANAITFVLSSIILFLKIKNG